MTLDQSVDENAPLCRICRDGSESGRLDAFCDCKGTVGSFHHECLVTWLKSKITEARNCELCSFSYVVGQETRPFLQWEWKSSRRLMIPMISLVGLILLCVLAFVALKYVWPVIEDELQKEHNQPELSIGEFDAADMRVAVIFLQAGLILVLVISVIRLGEKCKLLVKHLREMNAEMVVAPNNNNKLIVDSVEIDSNAGSRITDDTDTASADTATQGSDACTASEGHAPEVTSSLHSSVSEMVVAPNDMTKPIIVRLEIDSTAGIQQTTHDTDTSHGNDAEGHAPYVTLSPHSPICEMVVAPNEKTKPIVASVEIDSTAGSQTTVDTDTASADTSTQGSDAHTVIPVTEEDSPDVTSSAHCPISGPLEASNLLLHNQGLEPRQHVIVLLESVL